MPPKKPKHSAPPAATTPEPLDENPGAQSFPGEAVAIPSDEPVVGTELVPRELADGEQLESVPPDPDGPVTEMGPVAVEDLTPAELPADADDEPEDDGDDWGLDDDDDDLDILDEDEDDAPATPAQEPDRETPEELADRLFSRDYPGGDPEHSVTGKMSDGQLLTLPTRTAAQVVMWIHGLPPTGPDDGQRKIWTCRFLPATPTQGEKVKIWTSPDGHEKIFDL